MKTVQLKIIGQNVILIVENEQFSTKMADKDNRQKVKKLVDEYLKKPSESILNDILKMFPKKDNKTEKKSPPPKPTKDEPIEVQKVVEQVAKEEKPTQPLYEKSVPHKRYGGEY